MLRFDLNAADQLLLVEVRLPAPQVPSVFSIPRELVLHRVVSLGFEEQGESDELLQGDRSKAPRS